MRKRWPIIITISGTRNINRASVAEEASKITLTLTRQQAEELWRK